MCLKFPSRVEAFTLPVAIGLAFGVLTAARFQLFSHMAKAACLLHWHPHVYRQNDNYDTGEIQFAQHAVLGAGLRSGCMR